MLKLFRKEKAEAAARTIMEALDKTVNGTEKKWAWVNVHCNYCRQYMQQDPANVARFICHPCGTVVVIQTERHPKP